MSDTPLSSSNLAVHDGQGENPRRRNNSMPDLQSVSNSSASSRVSVVRDDGDADWQDEEEIVALPSGTRRSRAGNDSGDADRDHRHPSQRSSRPPSRPSGTQTQARPTIPHFHPYTQPNPTPTNRPNRPMGAFPPTPNPNNAPNIPNARDTLFASLLRGPGGAQPLGFAAGFAGPNIDGPGNFAPMDFNTFLNWIGGLGVFQTQPERPDAHRARRMVQALEPVPESLLKRLQRLQELGFAEEGDCMCAICWESLLSEGGGFDEEPTQPSSAPMDGVEGSTSEPGPSSGAAADSTTDDTPLPKTVTLPCTHTFHTACLIPWFSRPQGTTCPSCRFELDPEGYLTGHRHHVGPPGIPFPQTQNATGDPQFIAGDGVGHMAFGAPFIPSPATRTTPNMPTTQARRQPSRVNASNIRGLAQQLDGNVARARLGASDRRPSQRPSSTPAAPSGNPTPRAGPTNPFNPAAVGFTGSNTNNPFPGLSGTLLNGFFNSLPGGGNHNQTRGTNTTHNRTTPTSRGRNDEPPPLEPIPSLPGPSRPTTHRPELHDNDDDGDPGEDEMDVDIALDSGEEDIFAAMPWLPRAPPSQDMQDELLREMARSYASRMAELAFLEQQGQQQRHDHNAALGRHAMAQQMPGMPIIGGPGWLAVPAVPPTNTMGGVGMPTGQPLFAPGGGGAPGPQIIDGGVEVIMDGVDPDGNSVARMHFHIPGGQQPVETQNNPPLPTSRPGGNAANASNTSANPSQNPAVPPPGNPNPDHTHNPTNIIGGLQGAFANFLRGAGFNTDPNHHIILGGPQGGTPFNMLDPHQTPDPVLPGHIRVNDSAPSGQPPQDARSQSWQPPARTLLSVLEKVEQKERACGLRCWDPSCAFGPSDDDPTPSVDGRKFSQIRIKKSYSSTSSSSESEPSTSNSDKGKQKEPAVDPSTREFACEHTFHPGCLISANRVALSGLGGEVEPDRDSDTGDVEVHCPVCRTNGVIFAREWDEGCTAAASLLE